MSNYHKIQAGVSQDSDLSPLLYNIFTCDIPKTTDTILATYADDTAILSSDNDPQIATRKVQHHLNLISSWTKKWKIKLNEIKSTQVNFILNRKECPPLILIFRDNIWQKTHMERTHHKEKKIVQHTSSPSPLNFEIQT